VSQFELGGARRNFTLRMEGEILQPRVTSQKSNRFPPAIRRRPEQPSFAHGAAQQKSSPDVRFVRISVINSVEDSIIVQGVIHEIMFGRLKDWRRIAMRYDRCRPHVLLGDMCCGYRHLLALINES
jgi:hypothetical protein